MMPYDTAHTPPAITIKVTVSGIVYRRPQIECIGLLDTGADITAVPQTIAEQLNLYPMGRLILEDARATQTTVYTYEAQLALLGEASKRLEIILTPFNFVILGRDWLADYYIFLSGPEQRFLVSQTRLNVQETKK